MCGGTQNMTAYTYGNNLAGNISFTRSKKQTNILEVAKCLSLPAYAEHLSKCKTSESIFSKILWPVNRNLNYVIYITVLFPSCES